MHCDVQEEKTRGSAAKFQPNILMLGLSPCDYVLRSISKVQPNDLEQTLLVCTRVCGLSNTSESLLDSQVI